MVITDMVTMKLTDKVEITNADNITIQKLKRLGTFDNPDWSRRKARGDYVGFLEKYIKLWYEKDSTLYLPRGVARQAADIVDEAREKLRIIDSRWSLKNKPTRNWLTEDITYCGLLWDHQQEALERAMKYTQGIIVAPAGSGKTNIGIAIICKSKMPALWITHKIELIEQTKERFMKFSNIAEEDIGVIGQGKFEVGNVLTIATVQSLANIDVDSWDIQWNPNKTVNSFSDAFGCVIIDEAHHASATTWWETIGEFKAKYRIGLTATPVRSDGLEAMFYALIGRTMFEVPKEKLVQEEKVMRAHINVYITDFSYDVGNNNIKLINLLTTDPARNNVIASIVKEIMKQSDKVLVLTERINHVYHLTDRINAYTELPTFAFCSKEKFNYQPELEKQIIVATYGKAEEGLDIPDLDTLVFATPPTSEKKIIQSIGRIERYIKGKRPRVFDIYDDDVGILRGKWKKRYAIYEQHNYTPSNVHDITPVMKPIIEK